MTDKCTYCKKQAGDEPFRSPNGLPVCNGCAAKGGLLLLKLGAGLLMLKPKRKPKKAKPRYRLNQNATPTPQNKASYKQPKKKRKKKMKRLSPIFASLLCLMAFGAGLTVRCEADDDKDKDKDKQMQALNHMLTEHLNEGPSKSNDEPDFECVGLGIDDPERDTGFDLFFIHGCNDL